MCKRARASSMPNSSTSGSASAPTRIDEELGGRRERRERHCSLSRGAQRVARSVDERLVILDTGCAAELERPLIVVRQQLSMILGTPQGCDPVAGGSVLLGPCTSRD